LPGEGQLVSTPGKVVIENNDFVSSGEAILIAGDANGWYESGAVSDVLICGNRFHPSCLTSWYEYGEGIISICPIIPKLDPEKPYHRNIRIEDMDMICFGRLTVTDHGGRDCQFRQDQKRTFMVQRAMAASPLMLGGVLYTMDVFSMSLFTHPDILRCDQNGVIGQLAHRDGKIDVWTTSGDSKPNSGWIGIFNRDDKPAFVDEIEPLYPDSTVRQVAMPEPACLDAARGSIAGVHLLLQNVPPEAALEVEASGADAWPASALRFYRLLDVPVEVNSGLSSRTEKWDGKQNPNVIRRAPFQIFEVLQPLQPKRHPAAYRQRHAMPAACTRCFQRCGNADCRHEVLHRWQLQ